MFNKIYVKLKENIKFILIKFLITVLIFCFIVVPIPNSYIITSGGISLINEKITIGEDNIKSNYYSAYVNQLSATIPFYLISLINKEWDFNKIKSRKNDELSSNILLNNSIDNSIILAYKLANKDVNITNSTNEVIYIFDEANTTIEVGDNILRVDDKDIKSINDYISIINTKKVGDILRVEVIKNGKSYNRNIEILEENGIKQTGISIVTNYEYTTNPSININFSSQESGPSAGLMLFISIYDALTNSNFSTNKKIVGTGMIDEMGNVLPIGGVEYKFKAAIKENADIFIVGNNTNYQEVLNIYNQGNYDVKIIPVDNVMEAIKKLEECC